MRSQLKHYFHPLVTADKAAGQVKSGAGAGAKATNEGDDGDERKSDASTTRDGGAPADIAAQGKGRKSPETLTPTQIPTPSLAAVPRHAVTARPGYAGSAVQLS